VGIDFPDDRLAVLADFHLTSGGRHREEHPERQLIRSGTAPVTGVSTHHRLLTSWWRLPDEPANQLQAIIPAPAPTSVPLAAHGGTRPDGFAAFGLSAALAG